MSNSAVPSLGDSKPTQRTIAEITGLAVTTVSRALAGDEKIALKTRQQVAEVAREIGYVPDRAAQRLRTGRTNVIALVLDPHSEILGFSSSMIQGVSAGLYDTPYHLVLMQYSIDEPAMTPIRNIVRNRLADGVIIARTEPDDARVAYLMEAGFPFVTHGRTEIRGHAWLDYDNDAFARIAVEHLVQKGRRHIAVIAPSERYTFCRYMLDGFRGAVASSGIRGIVPDGFDLNSSPEQIGQGVAEIMSRPDAPDAWICPGEIPALAVHGVLHDMGLEIGDAVDIVAKQTSEVFDLVRPSMDAVYEDLEDAGGRMADLLLAQIEGQDAAKLHHLQSPRWADQQTVRNLSTITSSTSPGSRSHQSREEKTSTSHGPT